jgi:hypothetical protein
MKLLEKEKKEAERVRHQRKFQKMLREKQEKENEPLLMFKAEMEEEEKQKLDKIEEKYKSKRANDTG